MPCRKSQRPLRVAGGHLLERVALCLKAFTPKSSGATLFPKSSPPNAPKSVSPVPKKKQAKNKHSGSGVFLSIKELSNGKKTSNRPPEFFAQAPKGVFFFGHTLKGRRIQRGCFSGGKRFFCLRVVCGAWCAVPVGLAVRFPFLWRLQMSSAFASLTLTERLARFGVFGGSPRLRRIAFLRCRLGVFLSGSVSRSFGWVSPRFSASSVSCRVAGAGVAPAPVVRFVSPLGVAVCFCLAVRCVVLLAGGWASARLPFFLEVVLWVVALVIVLVVGSVFPSFPFRLRWVRCWWRWLGLLVCCLCLRRCSGFRPVVQFRRFRCLGCVACWVCSPSGDTAQAPTTAPIVPCGFSPPPSAALCSCGSHSCGFICRFLFGYVGQNIPIFPVFYRLKAL